MFLKHLLNLGAILGIGFRREQDRQKKLSLLKLYTKITKGDRINDYLI